MTENNKNLIEKTDDFKEIRELSDNMDEMIIAKQKTNNIFISDLK